MATEIILITSGNGFLGQHLMKHLQLFGQDSIKEIRVLDEKAFEKELEYEDRFPVRSFVGTVFDAEILKSALENVDTVVHLTEIKDVTMIPDVEKMKKVNVEGTAELVRACENSGSVKYFIFLSSFDVLVPSYTHKVYNLEISDVPVGNWMLEDYAGGKYEAEKLVFASDKFQSFIVRASPMFGELDDPQSSFIIKAMKLAKYCGGTLPVISACRDSVIQHTYVGNVAFGMVKILEKMISDSTATKEVVFILDDTPFKDFYTLVEPYLKARKCQLASRLFWFTPFYLPYLAFEKFVRLVQKCYDIKPYLKEFPSAAILYNCLHNWILFSGLKALTYMGYKPLYTYEQAVAASTKYYASVSL